jgi:hypothetical protein
MTHEEKLELVALLEEKARRARRRKYLSYFPDEGALRRELYAKHLASGSSWPATASARPSPAAATS